MKLEKLLGALLLTFFAGCFIYTGAGDYAYFETERLFLLRQEPGLDIFIAIRLSFFGLFMAVVSIMLIIVFSTRLEKEALARRQYVKKRPPGETFV